MLGTKNIVRNVPVRISTMKEYSAISPSRKDQWSGKILRPNSLTILEMPTRVSRKSAVAAMRGDGWSVACVPALIVHAPRNSVRPALGSRSARTGSPRLRSREATPAAAAHRSRRRGQLRQGSLRGTEDDLGLVGDVE